VATRDTPPGGPETLTTSFDLRKAREGTLVLELQRASDGKAVWRAGSSFAIDDKRIDAEVNRAVDILLRIPPEAIAAEPVIRGSSTGTGGPPP
jgi:hypothetical protein